MENQQVSLIDGGIQTFQNIFGRGVDTLFKGINSKLELDTLESELAIRNASQRDAALLGATGFQNDIPGMQEQKDNFDNTTKIVLLGGLALAGTIAAIAALR